LPPQSEARSARSSLPPQSEARAQTSSLPPPVASRPTRSQLPPQPQARPASTVLPPDGPAVGATGPIRTLGALDHSGVLSLATLDDEPAPAPVSDGMLPASMGPAAPRPARPARARNEPLDPFAPPDAATEEPLLQLASDDRPHRASTRASTPPAVADASAQRSTPSQPPAGSSQRATPSQPAGGSAGWSSQPAAGSSQRPASSQPSAGALPGPAPSQPPGESAGWSSQLAGGPSQRPTPSQPAGESAGWSSPAASSSSPAGESWPRAPDAGRSGAGIAAAPVGLAGALATRVPALASPRVRFAAGVALAIALGFLPAQLAAGMRERSAFGAIDARIAAVQATADTPDSYAALDAFRAEQLDAKHRARRGIVVTSLLIWAAAGGALAYAWFRGLPWQRG
jgi:hypothetical protein